MERGKAKIGIFAVGHGTYWAQFPGLKENLMGYHRELCAMVEDMGAEVLDFGMADGSEAAYGMVNAIQGSGIDVLFCNMVTYATSSSFAPILREVTVPMVLVALQPRQALDYTKASTFMQLENDNICSVPEFTGVAIRMGKRIADVIIGHLYEDDQAKAELEDWCRIARVLHDLRGARIGLMGHVLEAMYDMHTDPTAASAAFGIHVPLLEIDDAVRVYETVTEEETDAKEREILSVFDTPVPVSDPVTRKLTPEDLRQAARTAAALDKLVEQYRLTGLAYYYEGRENSIQRLVASSFIEGNSLLNARGVPMCGEYDLKTCIAMLIMDRLGIGGSFAEFHPLDFRENFILVGHDGPHHIQIAEGRPVLRSLTKYHGKPGQGASVEFKIKEGPITMLGITQNQSGGFRFVVGEGYSEKGPIPPTGNTNTRGYFAPSTREFVRQWVMEGPTHHFALGIGHHAGLIRKIGEALGIETVIVGKEQP